MRLYLRAKYSKQFSRVSCCLINPLLQPIHLLCSLCLSLIFVLLYNRQLSIGSNSDLWLWQQRVYICAPNALNRFTELLAVLLIRFSNLFTFLCLLCLSYFNFALKSFNFQSSLLDRPYSDCQFSVFSSFVMKMRIYLRAKYITYTRLPNFLVVSNRFFVYFAAF